MKRIAVCFIFFFLAVMVGIGYCADIHEGDILYVRYNLRGKGSTVYFHNMSSFPIVVPLGTKVEVVKVGREKIIAKRTDNGKKFGVYALSNNWNKFFVRDMNEIGIDSVNPAMKEQVQDGQVVDEMTKEEVYLSKGCPAYIGYGIKSFGHTYEEVMDASVWYYNLNSRRRDAVVTFENGKVSGFVDRQTKVKMKVENITGQE